MKFGVQLYNFRKYLAEDFKGTMKEIAKIGFDGVEYAFNFGEMEPEEIASFTKEIGLECCGMMFSDQLLSNPENNAWNYAKALNPPTISISETVDFSQKWQEILDICLVIQKNAEAKGFLFSYHNHWAEYDLADGIPAMYRILDALGAEKIFVEPDVCWLSSAGMDPASYIRKYGSRIKQVHFKDNLEPKNPKSTVSLGNGIVDLKSAFAAVKEINAQWLIYEQDTSNDPFKDASDSLAFMKSL